mgnify:CR=1 FL=1
MGYQTDSVSCISFCAASPWEGSSGEGRAEGKDSQRRYFSPPPPIHGLVVMTSTRPPVCHTHTHTQSHTLSLCVRFGGLCPADYFVRSEVRKGVLPEILRSLLQARARAREEIKHATDPMVKAVLNGRQLALKVSSLLGFRGLGAPCLF